MRWTCPRCDREFGAANQAHTCVPGCTVDAAFAGRREVLRALYDEIVDFLRTLGPVHEDAVTVGVFLKTDRKLAEVRPRSKDLSLALYLPGPLRHPRFAKVFNSGRPRVAHLLYLRTPDELDDEVRSWLAAAYQHATD